MAYLEHVNVVVKDGTATAQMLVDVFDWHVRWKGASQDGLGYTHHVGNETGYVALYQPTTDSGEVGLRGHLGIVVDDLVQVQALVEAAGFTPHHFADYEPGKRFYFMGPDDLEIEVVSYV